MRQGESVSANKYTGTLKFKVSGKEETADVTILTAASGADAGGGWECRFTIEHRGITHRSSFFIPGAVLKNSLLISALQVVLEELPKPLKNIDVRRAGFKPELVKR